MRTLVAAVLGLVLASSGAEAKAKAAHATKPAAHATKPQRARRLAVAPRPRLGRATAAIAEAERLPIRGQSIGVPWHGQLHDPAQLPEGDGYVIRRPGRSFGTKTTVEYIERVLADMRVQFPDQHVLGIGDLSAEHGGQITDHHSHQSGRDVDIGLFYSEKPASYPREFIRATADNLDCEATFALIAGFAATAPDDGGAQIIFLDYDVQGLIYAWAQDHGVDESRLARIFQWPHGRGSGAGLVRHFPGHDNHLHVRFKCPDADTSCR